VKLSEDSNRVGRRLVGDELGSPWPGDLRREPPLALPEQVAHLAGPRTSSPGMEEIIREHCADGALRSPGLPSDDDLAETGGPYEWRNAMLAVARVMAIWEQDVHRSADAWAKHLEEQVERTSANTARWEEMYGQLSTIAQRLTEIEQRVQSHGVSARSIEQRQAQLHAQTVATLEQKTADVQEAVQRLSERLHDRIGRTDESISDVSRTLQEAQRAATAHADEALRSATSCLTEALSEQGKTIGGAVASSADTLRQHVSALLLEDGHRVVAHSDEAIRCATNRLTEAVSEQGHVLGHAVASTAEAVRQHVSGLLLEECSVSGVAEQEHRTVHAALRSVRGQLRELHDVAREGHTRWGDEAARWRSEKERAELAAERAGAETREALQKVAQLEAEVADLAGKAQEAEPKVDEPTGAPAAVIFGKVKDIERRGAVRFNRQTGSLQVLKGSLDFAAVKPSAQATASFRDPQVAAQALGDIAELWKFFEGVLDLESVAKPGKGGKPEFWERMAAVQASHLKQELIRLGIPETMIICKGTVPGPGMDPGLRVTFKRDVFVDEAEPAPAKPTQTPRR